MARADGRCKHHEVDKVRAQRIFALKRALELRKKVHKEKATAAELSELRRIEAHLGPLANLGPLTSRYLAELDLA